MISKVFAVLALLIFTNCINAQQSESSQASLELRMQRTACYGECPVYSVSLSPTGHVIFEGVEFTQTKGRGESTIGPEKIKMLVAEIESADFFSLKDAYTPDSGNCPIVATDMPSVVLWIKLNGKSKRVEHYLGCFGTTPNSSNLPIVPRKLGILAAKIDEVIGTDRWLRKEK
jgi:hypothetical protein